MTRAMFLCLMLCMSLFTGCGDAADVDLPNACDANPCLNGGVCAEEAAGYACDCPVGYGGLNCEMQLGDLCDPNPCANGGECSAADGVYTCECADGFGGDNCETFEGGPCDPNPCLNGGVCSSTADGTALCGCPDGFGGDFCEVEVSEDPCSPNPCQNGGTCLDAGDGTSSCECASGFEGELCETETLQDPCDPNPCQNGGECTDLGDGLTACTCPEGYEGDFCENEIKPDPCPEIECLNMGVCVDNGDGTAFCDCPDGYEGEFCETEAVENPCEPNPCVNGGTCISKPEGISCICPAGWEGDLCELAVGDNPCAGNPCLNGGICTDAPDGGYQCQCSDGFFGKNCENAPGDGPCGEAPCLNGGNCTEVALPGGYSCSVAQGGPGCAENAACESAVCAVDSYCCNSSWDSLCASCADGTGGIDAAGCLIASESCAQPGGEFTYECTCLPEYFGVNCENEVVNGCEPNPCLNGGTCVQTDDLGAFQCECTADWYGTTCEDAAVNGCNPDPCQNGGTCTALDIFGAYDCNCPVGFTGMDCEVEIGPGVFDASQGGTIVFGHHGACSGWNDCVDGAGCAATACSYYGYSIVLGFDVITHSPGGGCTDEQTWSLFNDPNSLDENWAVGDCGWCPLNGVANLMCTNGFPGSCEPNPCLNGGACQEVGDNLYTCECEGLFKGQNCEIESNPCDPDPCQNGSTCVPVDTETYTCECPEGFVGANCDLTDPCLPNPCQNGGTCTVGANLTSFTCECTADWYGTTCEEAAVNGCDPDPCQNGGVCTSLDVFGAFACECTADWYGTTCEEAAVNGCNPDPCQNGGVCTALDIFGAYDCECPLGFTGGDCEIEVGPGIFDASLGGKMVFGHHGACSGFNDCGEMDVANGDPPGTGCATMACNFYGYAMVVNFDVINHSVAGGCTADQQWNLFYDNGTLDENWQSGNCNSCNLDGVANLMCTNGMEGSCGPDNPCQNGGTCNQIEDNLYNCTCVGLFAGMNCETEMNPCDPDPCANGGACVAQGPKEYLCECDGGFVGDQCQFEPPCDPNPCQNGGTCTGQNDGSFLCECAGGYLGTLCDVAPPDPCVPDPCVNGEVCVNGPDFTYTCESPCSKNSLKLDGASCLTADVFKQSLSEMTVEMWVRIDNATPAFPKVQYTLLENIMGQNGSTGFELSVPTFGANPNVLTWKEVTSVVDGIGATTTQAFSQAPLMPEAVWTHVAIVRTWSDAGATLCPFVNGTPYECQTQADLTEYAGNGDTLQIGCDDLGGGNFGLEGLMDELRISSIARYDSDFDPGQTYVQDDETVMLFHFDKEGFENKLNGDDPVAVIGQPQLGSPADAIACPAGP